MATKIVISLAAIFVFAFMWITVDQFEKLENRIIVLEERERKTSLVTDFLIEEYESRDGILEHVVDVLEKLYTNSDLEPLF